MKALFRDDSLLTVGERTRLDLADYVYDADRQIRRVTLVLAHGVVRALVGQAFAGPAPMFSIQAGSAIVAALHGITAAQARALLQQGGTLEVDGRMLACQIVNGQPSVARFNRVHYARTKELMAKKGCYLMDALSEVGLRDPAVMRTLKRMERPSS